MTTRLESLNQDGMRRLFTVARANALIPHLDKVFERIVALRNEITVLTAEVREDAAGASSVADIAENEEVVRKVDRLRALNEVVRERVESLDQLGVEVKDLDGLVDVRSRLAGRVVYLCWRRGETAFDHWHELDGGLAGRQPVTDAADFEGTLLN